MTESAVIVFEGEKTGETVADMKLTASREDGYDIWTAVFSLNSCDLYFYYFHIDTKEVNSELRELLNVYQRIALIKRLKKIKKILKLTNKNKLISKSQWNEDTLEEEISGRYGDTYLRKFLQKQELCIQPWIKECKNNI